jgi:hypothetical protein
MPRRFAHADLCSQQRSVIPQRRRGKRKPLLRDLACLRADHHCDRRGGNAARLFSEAAASKRALNSCVCVAGCPPIT